MGAIRDGFNTTYADGPSGARTQPPKADIRVLGGIIEDQVDGAAAGEVSVATWTALAAITGTRAGQPGRVANSDGGTHTDPVVGGTVNNAGEYSWSESPAGWRRIGNLPSTDVEAVINGAAAKATLVDGDTFGVTDSAASNVIKKHTWANLKTGVWTALGALIAGGAAKATPVDADTIPLSDSAASNGSKKLTWANLKAGIWSAFGALTAAGTAKTLLVDADVFAIGDSAASNASKKHTFANLKAGLDTVATTARSKVGNSSFGVASATAVKAGTAWTVGWAGSWVNFSGLVFEIEDLPETEIASNYFLYIDVDGDTAPYTVVKEATSSGLRADILVGKKIPLLYNATGVLVGPLAVAIETAEARFTRDTLAEGIVASIPGHAIRKMRLALEDPLVQMMGIVFMGDSITWGATVTGNAPAGTPGVDRDGTLSDPRDYATTPSYVNNLKAYIGAVYFPGATPAHTNWADSPSGEAITTWKKNVLLYPGRPPFSLNTSGSLVAAAEIQSHGATKLGYRYELADANPAGTSVIGVRFPFTGQKLKIWYTSIAASSTEYTLLINGVSQGDFSTNSGSNVNKLSREHTFDYVRDAVIEIRLKRNGGGPTQQRVQIEAIEIEKTCVITNQGINGSDTRRQNVFILSGNFDTLPFTDVDKFIFYQIGTNDRGIQTSGAAQPDGPLTLKKGLNTMIDRTYELVPDAEIVLMAANKTTDFDPLVFAYDMDQVKSTVRQVAADRQLDFIDNYSIFRGVDLGTELADGLHPNDAGHLRMSNNIIERIEAS